MDKSGGARPGDTPADGGIAAFLPAEGGWPAGGVAQILVCLTGVYAVLAAVRLPAVLAKLAALMRPDGGVPDRDFLGFSPHDALVRPVYMRIARNFREAGPVGFCWCDGFGLPMRERFSNNTITYLLHLWLGSRGTSLCGLILFALSVLAITAAGFGAAAGLVVTLLMLGSPMVVHSYTEGGKPETLWYGVVTAILYLGFCGHTLAAAGLWSLLCLANLMAPLLAATVVGPALLAWAVGAGMAAELWLGAAPGLVVVALRFLNPGVGYLLKMVAYCRKMGRDIGSLLNGGPPDRSLRPTLDEVLATAPVVLALGWGAVADGDPVAAFLALCCALAYAANRRVFFMSDIQTMDLLFLSVGVAYAGAHGHAASLLLVLVGTYRFRGNPFFGADPACAWGLLDRQGHTTPRRKWNHVLRVMIDAIDAFPALRALAKPRIPELDAFFAAIPDGERVMVETARSENPLRQAFPDRWMRAFWFWTEDVLPDRDVELITKEFTFTLEHELSMKRLTVFNATQTPADRLIGTCDAAAVNHVIVLSHATLQALQERGFVPVASFDFARMDPLLRAFLQVDVPGMLLMRRVAGAVPIVTPATAWSRGGNRLRFMAQAGTTYRIRYKHYPDFVARQGGARIPVGSYHPFDDVPELRFMTVTAPSDGMVDLRFDSGPFGLGMWSPFRLWRSAAKRTMQPDRDPAAAPPAGDRTPLPHEDDRCPSTGAFPSSR